MIELPKELWTLIKEYQIEHKKHHNIKYKNVIRKINYSFGPRVTINCISFPPPKIWDHSVWLQDQPAALGDFGVSRMVAEDRDVEFVTLKLELTGIEHHRKKCSNWASRFPPFYINACYGWKNLKQKHPGKY
jgi:hypothetical protein